MTRYFTLQQAERLLPDVERAIREAIGLKTKYQQAETELRSEMQRVTMLGGVDLNRGAFAELRARRAASAERLKETIEEIHEIGCLVKDLDIGLIDFPTLFRGEEVYLCWKLGETGIAFWHGVEEGFRGRKAIDSEFLENHQGELPN
jgi:hypothetical protein